MKAQLGDAGIEVAWHRDPGGLLREPVADLILVEGGDLVDLTALTRRTTAAPLVVIGAEGHVAATCLAIGADAVLPAGAPAGLVAAQSLAVLRRQQRAPGHGDLSLGRLRIDTAGRRAAVGGDELALRPREFDLLKVLVENHGRVLTRDRILEGAWGSRFVGEPKTVDVHVAWLRPKLEGSGLRVTTLRGFGYRLDVLEDGVRGPQT